MMRRKRGYLMTELEQLQAQKRAFEQDMRRADALRRLQGNPDFESVVLAGFVRDASLDALSASVHVREKDARCEALQRARAGGFLQAYFTQLGQRGDYARRAMMDMESALSQARTTGE